MKISLRWLQRHVDLSGIEPKRILADLTARPADWLLPMHSPAITAATQNRAGSVASAAKRSVSCPRRCATPRMTVGESAIAANAAITGVSSPPIERSMSIP